METKRIEVVLCEQDEKNCLVFKNGNDTACIDLESDDSEQIKNAFLMLIREIEKNPVELKFICDENYDSKKNGLFYDAAKEYFMTLKNEISDFENEEILQEIRNMNRE